MTRPNILLVTCHDLGRFLGCYGIQTVHSPNLDALAGSGARLTNAFTTAPSCSPARAALATGRYPHANGVMGLTHPPFGWDLYPNERHVAQILGDAGYTTHLFGFEHVSPYEKRPGFEQVHIDSDRGLALPVAARVSDLLRDLDAVTPWYIEVNLEEPHRPYDQGNCLPDDSLGVTVPGFLPGGPEAEMEIAGLQGAVRQADTAIGQILGALDDGGLRDQTCVVFAADHGIAMPRAKCTLYDPGLAIAMLLRYPDGRLGPGQAIGDLTSNIDLLPTLLDLAGVPMPEGVQGRSFLPALRGDPVTPRTAIFAEKTYHSYYDPMRAVRTERFKFIRNYEPAPLVEVPADIAVGAIYRAHVERYTLGEHPPVELYDLQSDPLESRNLAGDAEYATVQTWLDSLLVNWMRETRDPLIERRVPLPGYQAGDATAGRPDAC